MKQKTFYFILLLSCISAVNVFGQNDKKVFVMVHFEAGRNTTHPLLNEIIYNELGYPPDSLSSNNLVFQRAFWPSVVDMVQTADSFNIKLTLALQSQMAEYILQDTNKINIFNNWVQNGHELAMHHHGINHADWGGYTNRFQGIPYPDDSLYLDKFLNSGLYRGNMPQSFGYLQQLATDINDSVITGCITDTQIDKPFGIIYLAGEGKPEDLISVPYTLTTSNEVLYFLTHFALVSIYSDSNNVIIEDDSINYHKATQGLNHVMMSLNQLDDNEVMGIVFHEFDYYRFPDIYRDLFIFLNQNQVNNKSVKGLMDEIITGVEEETIGIPAAIAQLNQNYPNPFNPTTTIYFSLTTKSIENTEINIYNLKGQKIRQYSIFNNQSSIIWDGTDENNQPVGSGIYFYQLKAGKDFSRTKRMLLLK